MKTILVDPSLCIQCCNCQISCKDEHCDNDWSPIAATQPEGQFWIKVREEQVASGSRMKLNRVPVMCQHCEQCTLVDLAPEAVHRREDGIVIIDPNTARGNEALRDACPYGAVYWNDELDVAQKCTMCAHLLDAGWDEPRCVNACPMDALRFVDEGDLEPEKLYAPLERLNPEFGTLPAVAYVNLPKAFVAGSAYSPAENKCLDGVSVTLTQPATGRSWKAATDLFGEFKIGGLADGLYALELDKPGYDAKVLTRLEVRGALNVGDIRLYKTPC